VRTHIAAGTLAAFRDEIVANYVPSDKVLLAREEAKLGTDKK